VRERERERGEREREKERERERDRCASHPSSSSGRYSTHTITDNLLALAIEKMFEIFYSLHSTQRCTSHPSNRQIPNATYNLHCTHTHHSRMHPSLTLA